jgi:branched-chain amino acid transport system substrate-binding protein
MSKKLVTALSMMGALAFVAAACGGDNKSSTNTTAGATTTTTGGSTSSGASTSSASTSSASTGSATTTTGGGGANLPDNGPCDASKPKYKVGTLTVIESPVLSLKDDSTALSAAIKAFNNRGGVGGHCIELSICDSKGDPNKEVDCARQAVNSGVVATLSDQTPFNTQGVKEVMEAAGIPRIGAAPGTADLNSKVIFAFDAGGAGSTFMQVPGCTRNGNTKLAAVHVDTPTIGPLFAALGPMLKAYNATMETKIPLAAGTTDYQQFTLAAQNAGATCVIIPLGQNEAVQVLQAANQLNTTLKWSGSANTFNAADMKNFGDFAKQIYVNTAFPSPTASQTRWPILATILKDLGASGEKSMEPDNMKTSAIRSWMSVYALTTIMEKFGKPDDISRQSVMAAVKAAKDVDMFGLIPPWTPTFSQAPGTPFSSVSQPWYYVESFDAGGNVTVGDKQYNVIFELGGKLDYPQPTAAGSSGSGTTTTTG